MNEDLLAVTIAILALMASGIAWRTAVAASLQALRTEVRCELDRAFFEARRLLDDAVTMSERTMRAAYEAQATDQGGYRPNEREAIDLRNSAEKPLEDLKLIDTDLKTKSRRKLNETLRDIERVRRTIDEVRTRVEIKTAALDSLVRKQTGAAGPRELPAAKGQIVGVPLGQKAEPAKPQ